jgi:polar amino acid transport system substrate-binding protein
MSAVDGGDSNSFSAEEWLSHREPTTFQCYTKGDGMMSAGMLRRVLECLSVLLAVCLLFGAGAAYAETKCTFEQILDRGEIVVGVGLQAPPYGFRDTKYQPAGYDVEVAKLIAEQLGVKLKIVELTGANRIPYLLTNKVDVVLATFTITPERSKSISFTIPYCGASLLVVGYRSDKYHSVSGLAGRKVGVPRGTTNDLTLTAAAPSGTQIIRYEDDVTTTTALLTRRVDAIVHSDLLAQEIIQKNPDKDLEVKAVLVSEPLGMGVRSEDVRLLQWLNTFIFCNMTSGTLQEVYLRATGSQMLQLPMNAF